MGVAWAAASGVTNIGPWGYFAAALLGSSIPAVFILLWLRPVLAWLGRTRVFAGLASRLDARFVRKAARVEEKVRLRAERERRRAEAQGLEWTEELHAEAEARRVRAAAWVKYLSIFLFVAVPLPLTGIWTGSAVAAFLNTKFRYAFPCIVIGNVVAGLVIMLLTLGGVGIFYPGGSPFASIGGCL